MPEDCLKLDTICSKVNSIHGSICDACKANLEIETRILQPDSEVHLAYLEKERREIREWMNRNHDVLQAIPPEIVSDIFDLAINSDIKRRSAFFLGKVCSWWRRVAWSTPLLWRTITFILHDRIVKHARFFKMDPASYESDFALRVELLRDYIARAGALILDLDMSEHDKLGGVTLVSKKHLDVLGDILCMYVPQLHSLKLQVPQHVYHRLINIDAPNLRILNLAHTKGSTWSARDALGAPVDLKMFSRNVEELTVTEWEVEEFSLSYTQVKSLTLDLCTGPICAKLLHSTKFLKSCKIINDYFAKDFTFPPLYELEELEIIDNRNPSFTRTLLPRLRKMQLTEHYGGSPLDHQQVGFHSTVGVSRSPTYRTLIQRHHGQDLN